MPVEDVKIHCCGVEEKGHCFALEYRDECIFLDAGFNLNANYYDFLDLNVDEPYADVSDTVGAPILSNVPLENVKGFCLSHEHSDHVSGLPFLFTEVCTHTWEQPPIFSTRATMNGVQFKFDEHGIPYDDEVFISVEDKECIPEKYTVKRSSRRFHSLFKVKIGKYFTVMWVPVEHSTPNAYSLAVQLPRKRLVFYSGDFKLDLKNNRPPLNLIKFFGEHLDRISMICETIGIEEEGVTGTEQLMEEKLVQSLTGLKPNLILVAIRSSEVPRIHTFEVIANRIGRQIALIGDAMKNTYNSMRTNYPGILVGDYAVFNTGELKEVQNYSKYIFLADARMWHSYNTTFHNILKGGAPLDPDPEHPNECKGEEILKLDKKDLIILSTTGPYNNEMRACHGHMIRHIKASRAMFYPEIHVSGHGSTADYRVLVDLLNPEVIIPFHREKHVRGLLKDKVYYGGDFQNLDDGESLTWRN